MPKLNRRQFLAASAACSTLILAGTRASGRVLGANDTIRVGVIGLNGRGKTHIEMATTTPGMTLAAVCDVDPAVLARTLDGPAIKKLDQDGHKVQGFADLRKMLDAKDIDAVTVATPNHWHSLAAIWACQAGKDVLVEKPVSHNVWEGRQLAEAARKSGQIVQAGTQARANPDLIEAVAWVRAGNLGKIRYAQGLCYNPRLSIGKVGHGQIPPGLDYDLWSGPVAIKPLEREKLHYDWHWIYDYGNGDIGNQGVHEMDIARWFLGYETLSPRVMSIGGRLGYDDDGQTPNTQLVYHDYDGAPLIFEVRGLPKSKEFQVDKIWQKNMDSPPRFPGKGGVAVEVVAEGGRFVVVHGGEVLMAVDNEGKTIRDFAQPDKRFAYAWRKGDHFLWTNWVTAMQSRKPSDLKAPVAGAHLSSALGHMGTISHRLGQTMSDGAILERIQGNKLAAERFEAVKEHLAKNEVDLSKTPVTLGPWLTMDPKAERFIDNPAANALARPEYRKPYEVTEVA
jgi:predicted dehydrogenase